MLINYQKFISGLLLVCFFIGCDPNLLETVPNDRISSEIFWQTEQDAVFAANSVYLTLDGLNIVGYDGITDLVLTNRGFDANVVIQRGQLSADTGRFLNEWSSAYTGIRRANDFLDNIDRVQGNIDTINRITGEVMTLRAYHYIKLAMLFGDVPLITTGIDISEGKSLTRNSVNEVWDFIALELDQAASMLPWQNTQRVNRGTAYGLKARAMLYAGRYAEAAESAQNVIQSGEYDLYPDYYELFQYNGQGNSEILLARERARDFNAHNVYNILAPWSQIPGANGSTYVPTAAMIDKYEMDNGLPILHPESGYDPFNPYDNRDPRLYASVFLNNITEMPDGQVYGTTPGSEGSDAVQITVYSTITGYNIRKYVAVEDYGNPGNSGLNTSLLRFAEVLLTYAEAKIEMNDIDQSVYDAINRVRQRPTVEMPEVTHATASSQNELRELVRNERTVELAFEGFRLFDIRRWKIAEEVMPGIPQGITYVVNGELRQVEIPEREATFNSDRDYLWPIPIREIELNSNLTQNPGW